MAEVYFGSNFKKISNLIDQEVNKFSGRVIRVDLDTENFDQEIYQIGNQGLFDEKILYLVDFTKSAIPELKKIIERFLDQSHIIFFSTAPIDGRTELGKFLNKIGKKFDENQTNYTFTFTKNLFDFNREETFKLLEEMRRSQEKYVAIFGAMVYYFNSLVNVYFNTSLGQKNFNYRELKKISEKYDKKTLQEISSVLYQDELKFKKGQITDEMMVINSVLSVLKYGNHKS